MSTAGIPLGHLQTYWLEMAKGRPDDNAAAYTTLVARVAGPLRVWALEQAFAEIVRRHEALRTSFVERAGQVVQVVAPADDVRLPLVDLGGLSRAERETEARRLVEQESRRRIDLQQDRLLRPFFLRLDDEDHVLVVTAHRIGFDDASQGILAHELSALYGAIAAHRPSPLPELGVQYRDVVARQRQWLEKSRAYWRAKLAGAPGPIVLRLGRRSQETPAQRRQHDFTFAPGTVQAIQELGYRRRATPFMTLLAAYATLLCLHSGERDIVIGTAVDGRPPEARGLIGRFGTSVVIRVSLVGAGTFGELLRQVRKLVLEALEHQYCEPSLIYEQISDIPMFDYVDTLAQRDDTELDLLGCGIDSFPLSGLEMAQAPDTGQANSLGFSVRTARDRFRGEVLYDTGMIGPGGVETLVRDLEALLVSAREDPGCRLSSLLGRPGGRDLSRG